MIVLFGRVILIFGTYQDNSNDMIKANRQAKGEDLKHSKLSMEQIKVIRNMAKFGIYQQEIATIFNITQGTVNLIINRKIWKHV